MSLAVCGQTKGHSGLRAAWVDPKVVVCRLDSHYKLPFKGLTQNYIKKRVNAAVSVTHANSNVIDIIKRGTGFLYSQMDKLKDVVRSPTDEKSQTDCHSHPSHTFSAHLLVPRGKRCHWGRHVLQDFKEHHTDNHERKGECQHKLIDSKPADVDGWIRKQESTTHLAVVERHQASVH